MQASEFNSHGCKNKAKPNKMKQKPKIKNTLVHTNISLCIIADNSKEVITKLGNIKLKPFESNVC